MMQKNYSFGIERNDKTLKKNDLDPTKWTNPLEVRLPHAPSMKIYCVYGHGKETEVRIALPVALSLALATLVFTSDHIGMPAGVTKIPLKCLIRQGCARRSRARLT